eukprot:s935_g12.t1
MGQKRSALATPPKTKKKKHHPFLRVPTSDPCQEEDTWPVLTRENLIQGLRDPCNAGRNKTVPVEPNSKTCVFVDPAAVVGVPILQEGFWECPVNLGGHEELSLLFKQQCQTLANKASAQLQEIQEKHPGISVSVGSIGHPETCNWPCRFMKRAAGCVHGAACARCHLCTWSKTSLKMETAWKKAHSTVAEESDGSKAIVSLGSIGHPQQCAWACRFMKRPAGCHNKAACPRCHLCTWSKDPRALQCADESLKSNRTFLLKALANCPQALDFVDISVRFDPELVKIALGQEYRPVSPKERPSSPKPAAPPKPRSRRSRRALLLDERRRRLSRSPDTKSARDPVKPAGPVENSLEPTTTIPEQ